MIDVKLNKGIYIYSSLHDYIVETYMNDTDNTFSKAISRCIVDNIINAIECNGYIPPDRLNKVISLM